MKVSLFFRWYDLWIGAFYDQQKRTLYICPIPTIGVKIQMSEQQEVLTKPIPTKAVCKFTLRSLKDYGNDNKEVELFTRYDSALPEDQKFSKFTPSGEMKFTLQNPALDGFFQPGKTYLITIEPSE